MVLNKVAPGRQPADAMITPVIPPSNAVTGAAEELIGKRDMDLELLDEPRK